MTVQPGTRPLVAFNFLSGNLDTRLSFTRASTAMAYDSAGVLTSYAINVPRFDYDPVTLAPKGLLIEEARTNILLRSADMTHAAWGAGGGGLATAVSGAAAPDGTTNAATITDANAGATLGLLQSVAVVSGTTVYTGSVYVKAGTSSVVSVRALLSGGTPVTGEIVVNLATGAAQWRTAATGTSFAVSNAGNGWWRVASTITDNASGNTAVSLELRPAFAATYSPTIDAAATGTAVFWGAQIEVGTFALSYIPTTAATVTRAVDVGPVLTSAFGFNAAEGTLFVVCTPIGTTSGSLHTAIYLDDGTSNERMGIRSSSATNAILVVDGGATQVNIGIGTIVAGTRFKAAFVYKLNNFAGCMNGGSVSTDAAGTIPTVTKMQIGSRTSGTEVLSGWYGQAAYYARRLDNATVQRITT
jgi:hypothetical protein